MMRRWILGISVLWGAACSSDECPVEDAYCDGNVAHYCNGGGDKGPLKWESSECSGGTICMKGACLVQPLVACSTPHARACSEDGQRAGQCLSSGYWRWEETCDAALGETCLPGSTHGADEPNPACVFPSLGTCSPGLMMCHQDLALYCYNGYWKIFYTCNSVTRKACHLVDDGQAYCFSPNDEECSTNDRPACRGNQILECTADGHRVMSRDCALDGLFCQNGTCVPVSAYPAKEPP
jgi:hypothetical protein